MRANEQVQIQSQVTVDDGSGGRTVSWTTDLTVWCKVKAVRGREIESLGRQVSAETYLLETRYGPAITTAHRAVWGAKILSILSAQDRDGRRQWLTLECEVGRGA